MSDTAFKSDYDTSPLHSRNPAEPTYAVRRFQFSIDTTNYKFLQVYGQQHNNPRI